MKTRRNRTTLHFLIYTLTFALSRTVVAFTWQSRNQLVRSHFGTQKELSAGVLKDLDQEEAKPSKQSFSNFWYSETDTVESLSRLPNGEILLDSDGPLPQNCYVSLGDDRYESKPTCRVTIDILTHAQNGEEADPELMVHNMQKLVDSGFTTFGLVSSSQHLESNLHSIYGKFYEETPTFVSNMCNLIVPYQVPTKLASSTHIRDEILGSLLQIGTDSIDTLQIHYSKTSMYNLDVIDAVTELQREGFIRSIGGQGFPSHVMREARACGFSLDFNRINMNLLDGSSLTKELDFLSKDMKIPLLNGDTLAGDLLTDKYIGQRFEPLRRFVSPLTRYHLRSSLRTWRERHELLDQDRWVAYQSQLLPALSHIALKYRVSIASVALRWSLQVKGMESAALSCRLDREDDHPDWKRLPRDLRRTFTFVLDEEDIETLNKISGDDRVDLLDPNLDEWQEDMEYLESSQSGLFLRK